MKKFFLLLTLLFVTSDAWALNKFARTGGGNWTDNATWSTTSGGVADTTAPTSSDDVFLDANSGNVTISATSVGKSLTCTGYTGTLTHNAFTLTISGSITFVAGMTYTPADSAVLLLGINSTGTLTTGGKLLQCFTSSGTGTVTLGDNLDFVARKTTFIQVGVNNPIALNGKTVSGNSATNRLLIRSGTLGTASTITNTTGTFANADFRDIAFSTNADYSAITGLSGDCGGNSGATLTTGTTQTYTGGTGSWSDVTKWTSRVPLPQDDVSMSGVTGGTITADMPRLGKSIDWTGASGSPTWSVSTQPTIYGSLTLISAMTHTNSVVTTFEGRGTHTIESAGKSFGANIAISAFGGSYTLSDGFTMTAGTLFLNSGTFDPNEWPVTVAGAVSITGTTTRAFDISNSTITISSGTGNSTIWNASTTTGLTFTSTGSTINLNDTGASGTKTFHGGGLTYHDYKISGNTAGLKAISGANTFNRIYTSGTTTYAIQLPGSTTTTILSGQGLGNGTNVITFTASAGSATISKSGGGLVDWDYVSLTNIPANTGTGATYYAGSNSTDGGGNTNWLFTDAPDVGSRSGSIRNLFLDEVPRSRMVYV